MSSRKRRSRSEADGAVGNIEPKVGESDILKPHQESYTVGGSNPSPPLLPEMFVKYRTGNAQNTGSAVLCVRGIVPHEVYAVGSARV
jgi:hypothetical protein